MKRETNAEGGMVGGASGLGPRPVRCKPVATIATMRRREPAARQLFPPEAGSTPEQEHAGHAEWLGDMQDAFLQAKHRHYDIDFGSDPAEGTYAVPSAAVAPTTTSSAPSSVPTMTANNHDNSCSSTAMPDAEQSNGLPLPELRLFATHPTTSRQAQATAASEYDPIVMGSSISAGDAATWLPSDAGHSTSTSPSTPSRRS